MILFVSAVLAFANFRFAGEAGRRRFEALSDRRAQVQHDYHRGTAMRGYLVAVGAISCVDAAVSAWLGSARGTIAALGAVLLAALAGWWGRSARSNVLSGFAARGLAPLHQRELSRRRSRRTRLFLAVALVGYLAMGLARLVDDDLEPRWLFVVAMAGVVAVLVGVLGAGWAAVWRYGDEEPDPT